MKTYYEHIKTKEIFSNLEQIGKKLNISTTWAFVKMKTNEIPFRTLTEKEVMRRASAYSKIKLKTSSGTCPQ